MAAAALSASRGAAGGLYVLFTLMCLVGLASSRFDSDKLKNLKEDVQRIEQNIDHLKAQRDTFSELMSNYMSVSEPMMAFVEEFLEESSEDFLPMKGILDNARGVMENTKTLVDGYNESLDVRVADLELKVGITKKYLQVLEQYQAEL